MKQRCRKVKRVEKKQDGTMGLTEHVRFLKVSWKFLAKTNDEKGARKGYERVYARGYKCTPFV